MARIDFDSTGIEPSMDFSPLPAGDYLVTVDKTELVSKEGKSRLAYECSVLDGAYAGRKIFGGFNLVNPSEKAVQISKSQLADLTRACGKVAIDDSEELHGIPVIAKVKVKPAQGQYPAGNEIVGWKPADGSTPAATETNNAPTKSAPWGSK